LFTHLVSKWPPFIPNDAASGGSFEVYRAERSTKLKYQRDWLGTAMIGVGQKHSPENSTGKKHEWNMEYVLLNAGMVVHFLGHLGCFVLITQMGMHDIYPSISGAICSAPFLVYIYSAPNGPHVL